MIRIVLVDDSEVIRFLLTKSLERDPDLKVVAAGANGVEAIELAKKHRPDVLLLDIQMPVMGGLTALPGILEASPTTHVIIITGASQSDANLAIDSLSRGAHDFILKPGSEGAGSAQEFNEDIRKKIKALPAASKSATKAAAVTPELSPTSATPAPITRVKKNPGEQRALAIASSTGGPEALQTIFRQLQDKLTDIPIFITQHMPPKFTAALAEHLSRYGSRACREAIHGEAVAAGIAYVAPGGKHMLVRKGASGAPTIFLTEDTPVNSCRPSADPMFASISEVYRDGLVAVVLTGIGQDGLNGARTIVENGGKVVAQDKASSVVYGMPRAIADAGIADAILPLDQIAANLVRRF